MAAAQLPAARLLTGQVVSSTAALRNALAGLEPGGHITIFSISAAFAAVRRVGRLRRAMIAEPPLDAASDRELNQAISDFLVVLREWNQQLPRVHGWLLAEKARLSARCEHTESLKTWLETDRQTR